MTDGRASVADIQKFFSDIQSMVAEYSPKRWKQLEFIFVFLWLTVGPIVLIIVLTIISTPSSTSSDDTTLNVIFLPWGFCFVLLVCAWISCTCIRSIGHKKKKKMMQLVQQYLENNQASWVERGLKWQLPSDFPYWIELYKEYKASAGMGSQ